MGNKQSAPRSPPLPNPFRVLAARPGYFDEDDPALLYTKSTGLYAKCSWDDRLVRKLIHKRALAPRFPGLEDRSDYNRDECPICLLFYPMLNSTRCCSKDICTECFLQIRPPRHVNRASCPFCKQTRFDVGFTGPKCAAERERQEEEEALTQVALHVAETNRKMDQEIAREMYDAANVADIVPNDVPSSPHSHGPAEDGHGDPDLGRNENCGVSHGGNARPLDKDLECLDALARCEENRRILDEALLMESLWLAMRADDQINPTSRRPKSRILPISA